MEGLGRLPGLGKPPWQRHRFTSVAAYTLLMAWFERYNYR